MLEKSNSYSKVVQDDYKVGQQQLAEKQYAAAICSFTLALKTNPQHKESVEGKITALCALAKIQIKNKDWAIAEVNFNEAHQFNLERQDIVENLAFVRRQKYLTQNKNKVSAVHSKRASSSQPRVDNLVFQGGGIKGLAYLGALEALYENIDMSEVKRFGGASAGAINALVLGLGYSQEELQILLKEIDFTKVLMDGEFKDKVLNLNARTEEIKAKGSEVANKFKQVNSKNPFSISSAGSVASKMSVDPDFKTIKEGLKLLTQQDFGLFPGDLFREGWAEPLIQAKTGVAYATFKELHDLAFKPIYFIGTNISTGNAEVFSYETTPDVIVSDALRISMSIPLFFKPHQLYIKQDGQRLLHPNKAWYVDGGLIDNYPLWIFDKACYWQNSPVLPQALSRNPYTLGLRLTTAEHKEIYEGTVLEKIAEPFTDLGSYLWGIIQAVYGKQNSDHVKFQEQDRSIYIDYLGIKTTQFDLGEKDQEALIKSGYDAVNVYFQKRNLLSDEKTPLDIALEEDRKSVVLKLIAHGMYACQSPQTVHSLLKEAVKSEWVDTKQILDDLKYFEAYHQKMLEQHNPNSISAKFF